MRSAEYQRGYDAGYRDALHAALSRSRSAAELSGRFVELHRKLGGPDSRFKPRGVPGSIYND